jgi:hypothetical protein
MASDAVRSVLSHVWNVIEPLGHPCALMGGLALAVWSHPRSTRDVDLLLGIDRAHIDVIVKKLQSQGCRPKKMPLLHVVGDHSFVHLLYTPPGEFYEVQFDLLLAESPLQKSALNRCVQRTVEGIDRPIKVLDCNDLILFKLLAGRLIDRADAAMLLRENRDTLDMQYLSRWIEQLDLKGDFQQIWHEAYPTESLPDILA